MAWVNDLIGAAKRGLNRYDAASAFAGNDAAIITYLERTDIDLTLTSAYWTLLPESRKRRIRGKLLLQACAAKTLSLRDFIFLGMYVLGERRQQQSYERRRRLRGRSVVRGQVKLLTDGKPVASGVPKAQQVKQPRKPKASSRKRSKELREQLKEIMIEKIRDKQRANNVWGIRITFTAQEKEAIRVTYFLGCWQKKHFLPAWEKLYDKDREVRNIRRSVEERP